MLYTIGYLSEDIIEKSFDSNISDCEINYNSAPSTRIDPVPSVIVFVERSDAIALGPIWKERGRGESCRARFGWMGEKLMREGRERDEEVA